MGVCPADGASIEVGKIHYPGVRVVLEGRCRSCEHRLLQDLPAGYGLLYPATLDLDTGRVWGRWFPDLLIDGWAKPDRSSVGLEIRGSASGEAVVFLPALDFVYGHALMALLNAQRHLDDGNRVVVLVPRSLAHLVPGEVAETWIFDEPLSRLRGWLTDLSRRLNDELSRFTSVVLSPAFPRPHPSTWDIARFTGPVAATQPGTPSVVFVSRTDRLWDGDRDRQARRFADVFGAIKTRFPRAQGSVVGVGPAMNATVAGLRDLQREAPSVEDERSWLSVAAGADLVVGVHGSNMLLPSALGAATIELLPEDRFSNYGDATLLTQRDPVRALFRHRVVLGVDDLSDVSPQRVAKLAIATLDGVEGFDRTVLGIGSGLQASPNSSPEREPPWERSRQSAHPSAPLLSRLRRFGGKRR